MKLRDVFGRYLPDTIIKKIMDSPSGPSLDGEKRFITILITDIRGFTTLSEKYDSDIVVKILNNYFTKMVDILHSYNGTVIEFIGDSVLAIFGAPLDDELQADHAVACALQMQLAMTEINQWNGKNYCPSIEMGIGINSGFTIVGNIGSDKAMKYNIIGKHVNLASRIESYTAGGQIFVSDSTLEKLRAAPVVINTMEINPKGFSGAVKINQVIAIGEPFNIIYEDKNHSLLDLETPVQIVIYVIKGKDVSQEGLDVNLQKLSESEAVFQIIKNNNIDLNIFDEVMLKYKEAIVFSKITVINDNQITVRFKSESEKFVSAIKTITPARTSVFKDLFNLWKK
jgi:adenylate cyclase